MYKIIGADGKEYGPVSAEILMQWIAQGRVNAQTRVFVDGASEAKAAGDIPALAAAFATAPPPPLSGPPPSAGGSPLPPDVRERDYDLDLGGCIGRAWALVTGPQMWLVIGGVAIWLLIQAGLSGFAQIPFIGLIFSLASLVVSGPLLGGIYLFVLRCLRGEAAEVSQIFDGFRHCFAQLFLGQIVTAVLTILAALPGIVLLVAGFFPLFSHHDVKALGIALIAVGFLVALAPTLYLSVSWFFTLPLIIDKRLDFWPAMQLSRAVVGRHWWLTLVATMFCGVLSSVGVFLCCIGVFFTVPLGLAFVMCCYEKMFSPASTTMPPTQQAHV